MEKKIKIVAIIQARMGSVRLPGKVLKEVNGKPLIGYLIERLSKSNFINKIVLATSTEIENDSLEEYVRSKGVEVFRGSEQDVLERYYKAAQSSNADVVVRVTGDCPLVDPKVTDLTIEKLLRTKADIVTNAVPPSYPDGLDNSVFWFKTLEKAHFHATEKSDREHVTSFLYKSEDVYVERVKNEIDYSDLRWTIDEPEDFVVISRILNYFHPRIHFDWNEVLELVINNPEKYMTNSKFKRNEGGTLGTGQKLWKRAKRIIPGGNMLLSKRSEMFLPDLWPSYFSKSKGCEIWDLDNNHFYDLMIMGIGTNTLGYGNKEVDNAVFETVRKGNMSTLNCPEEVFLAEKLVEMHPWSDMVRFARTGGEANTIALRLGRAASGKDKIAFCGYHGWHDWYLSANLSEDKGLDGHLLPGLEPKGVPDYMRGQVFPFNYNNFEELLEITQNNDVGVIIMEVMRNIEPEDNFLHKVRKLATEKGIVLVFDECSSGFRQTFGGLHLQFGIEPDIAMFGKTLGNGYAINAVIGRKEVMKVAQDTFISSTFWTERIGPTAGLATLEVMEKTKSWERLVEIGNGIEAKWKSLALKYELDMRVFGLPALLKFAIKSPDFLKYKTFITQAMMEKGFLASNTIYVCTEHSESILALYYEAFEPILETISKCEKGELNIDELLKGPVCHSGFHRIN